MKMNITAKLSWLWDFSIQLASNLAIYVIKIKWKYFHCFSCKKIYSFRNSTASHSATNVSLKYDDTTQGVITVS